MGERRRERDVEVNSHILLSEIPHNYCHQVAESVYLWMGRWQIAAASFTQCPVPITATLDILIRSEKQQLREYLVLVKAAYAPQSGFTAPANLRRDAITKGHREPF